MKRSFEQVCKECQGYCCTTVFLGQSDVDKLTKAGKNFRTKKLVVGYELEKASEGNCPFLEVGKGCTLNEELKPFDCVLFPLAFTKTGEKYTFYLNKKCPYFNQAPKEWIDKTIIWALDNINNWSQDEIEAYIKRQEGFLASLDEGA